MPELRLTLRALARQPAFTLNAILSLALGIGATTAIFSLLDRAVFRPLPVRDPERLVLLYQPGPLDGSASTDEQGGPSFSYPLFRGLQHSQKALTGLAGARRMDAHLAYGGEATTGVVHRVSGNYFDVLGVPPTLGRVLGPEDDRLPGAHSVAVLGYAYWASRWGSDPGMLNRTIVVNGHPFTIVGVAARGFEGERKGGSIDVFVPISMNGQIVPDWNAFDDRRDHWVTLVGRLPARMTLEQAAAALQGVYRAELEQDIAHLKRRSDEYLRRYRSKRIALQPGQWGRGGMRERARPPLMVLLGMAALLLVMACTNVTSLQLARATAREREVAVRVALGASRHRVMRDVFRESVVLGAAAAVLGLLIAHGALRGILAIVPPGAATVVSATMDARVLTFCLAVATLATLLSGSYPALRSWRPDLVSWLRTSSADAAGGRRGGALRRSLVAAQIGLSLVLLVSAGLLARSFAALMRIDLGIEPERLLTFSLDPKLNRYSDARALALFDELTGRLRALPGVVLVSAARVPAIAGHASGGHVTVEGFTPPDEDASECNFNVVGSDYFRTMGTPLIAGRELEASDDARSPKVAVVNEAFVRRFVGDAQPLGRRFGFGLGRSVRREIEIVGVVRDARYSSIRDPVPPVYYVPYRQAEAQSGLQFYVRTNVDPIALVAEVRRTVAALDPHLPVGDLKTMPRHIADSVRGDRLLSLATGGFAGVACLLAAIGIYGVLAYDVARRTREIGVRRALGARTAQVRGLVLRQAGRLLLLGVPAGLAAAAAAGTLLQAVLVGASPMEPLVYAAAVAFVVVIAVLAAWIPAWRASRVDPMVALRSE